MDYRFMNNRESLSYIVGQIDAIITTGWSLDGEDLKRFLTPIRNELTHIYETIGAEEDLQKRISH